MLAQRIQSISESLIREMSRLAYKYNAINLAQGMPELETPQEMKDAACRAIQDGFNQYPITWGAQVLRQAIADDINRKKKLNIDPDENITVCCGATESMMATLLALINPGDDVIVFQPFYENYYSEILITGARPVFIRLHPPQWEFNCDELAKAFTRKTKAIIINNPHNPTGHVFTKEELSLIVDLCCKHNVYIISDEIYEYIVYPPLGHISIASLPGARERTITINGLSKTYNITGWRIGYCIAPSELTNGIRKVHDFLTIGAPHPLQIAGAVALSFPDTYYQSLLKGYVTRRDKMLSYLRNSGFLPYEPEGAYYIMAEISQFGLENSLEFSRLLTASVGVAVVPGSAFYVPATLGKNQVRFMFAKPEEILIEAGQRLMNIREVLHSKK